MLSKDHLLNEATQGVKDFVTAKCDKGSKLSKYDVLNGSVVFVFRVEVFFFPKI